MKIYIEDQVLEYANNKEEMTKILETIDIIITKHGKIINYMIIDGIEVFESYYDYFQNNIKSIEKIHVISHTYQDLVDEILKSTWEYIERAPAGIESLANNFYKNPHGKDWEDLDDFLGGLSWIISTSLTIDQDSKLKDTVSSYETWNTYAKEVISLGEVLPDFEEALFSKDNILIADILSYEILPILNSMAQKLLKLVNVEGSLDDLN